MQNTSRSAQVWPVFWAFLRLGLIAFGGPAAHLGYFRTAFVERRRWLGDAAYADLIAAAQFLPGPASSKVGIGIGLMRAGLPGAAAAWLGFTLPSALIMVALGAGWARWSSVLPAGLIHGLKLVAVAVVAQAVLGMAASLAPDARRRALALAAMAATLAADALGATAAAQIAVIVAGALAGRLWLGQAAGSVAAGQDELAAAGLKVSPRLGAGLLLLAGALLAGLPLAATLWPDGALARAADFYRTGAMVFGGGHVALPLFAEFSIGPGGVDAATFLAGYAVAQALPGPLFTFAGFLGAAMSSGPAGWPGGALAVVAVFAPGALLIVGGLPFWARLRRTQSARAAIAGVNAAVLGLLAAALVSPVGTGSIAGAGDLLAAAAGFALLVWRRWPPWAVVLAGAGVGLLTTGGG